MSNKDNSNLDDSSLFLSDNSILSVNNSIFPDLEETDDLSSQQLFTIDDAEIEDASLEILSNIVSFEDDTSVFQHSTYSSEVVPPLHIQLKNDTGAFRDDGMTNRPKIIGRVQDVDAVMELRAGLNTNDSNQLLDITDLLHPNGRFILNRHQLINLNRGKHLSDGDYTLNLVAIDETGNEFASSNLSFTLDRTLPELELTTHLDNAVITPKTVLRGTVADDVVFVSYRLNEEFDSEVPIAFADGHFQQTIDISGREAGREELVVLAIDRAGNATIKRFSVQIQPEEGDTHAPVITAELETDYGAFNDDGLTNIVTIGGTVTDDSSIVSFKAGINTTDTEQFIDITDAVHPDGRFRLDADKLAEINGGQPLADGEQTIYLAATDEFGNSSEPLPVSFTLDTVKLGLDVSSPAPHTVVTTDTIIQGSVMGEDVVYAAYRYNEEFDTEIQLHLEDGNFNQQIDLSGRKPGEDELVILVIDKAGNLTLERINIEIPQPDNIPPTISAQLANDTGAFKDDNCTNDPTVTGMVEDNGTVVNLKAALDNNNPEHFIDITGVLHPDGSFTLDEHTLIELNNRHPLADGDYQVALIATDAAGNVSQTFSISFTLDRTLPDVHVNKPNNHSILTPTSKLIGTVADDVVYAAYRYNEEFDTEIQLHLEDSSFNQQIDFAHREPGADELVVLAVDKAGNLTLHRINVEIPNPDIDNDAPIIAASLVEDTGINNNDGITSNPEIAGSVRDESEIASFQAGFNSNTVDLSQVLQPDGSFSLSQDILAEINNDNLLPDGDYTLNLTATDAAGNEASFPVTFTLDTTAPEIDVILPVESDRILPGTNLTGTINEDLASLTYRFNDGTEIVLSPNENGEFSQELDLTGIDFGVQTITLTATDIAGNLSSTSINVVLVEDDGNIPLLNAALANDTGTSSSDNLTLDPTITGQIESDRPIESLTGSLNGGASVDISDGLGDDGNFTVGLEQYELLSNGSLPDGDYTLALQATDDLGIESETVTVAFTIDRTAPPIDFNLAAESDTGTLGDGITTERLVTLEGQTDPGLTVVLVETQQEVIANSEGKFTFTDVSMPVAGTAPFTVVTVDEAGNQGRVTKELTREGINGAPEITSSPELIFDAENQTTYNYQVTATEPDGDDLTYTVINAPNETEIDENGNLSFTPGVNLEPSYDFTVQVDDGRGGTDVQEFTVEVPSLGNLGTIKGIKWEDLNENGVRDSELVQGANPDVVYVLDVSGSADFSFAGSPIGDFNGDGLENTRLDAEIAAFIALNEELNDQGLGEQAQVAIVVYSGFTANADMDLVTDGLQLTTTPGADSNSDGITDVEEILRSIRSGAFGVGNFTGTNPEAALQKVEETFTAIGTEAGNGNLIFLTDGEQNRGGSINDEVERLREQGFNLSAFGVGNDASLGVIQTIDPDGIRFASIDEILEAFGGVGEGSQSVLEPGLAGVTVYLDTNNNGILDPDEPVQITAEDDPTTPDIDETGQYEFNNLVAGTYTIREVVPEGFEQTFPTSTEVGVGDGFADVVLDYFNSGAGTFDEPYGVNNNGIGPVIVDTDIILGSDTNGALSLPTGSFVTVGFNDEIIIDGEGNDIFILELGGAGERAEVFVSSDLENFTFLGIGNGGQTSLFDLADIGFTEPVRAIKIMGLDSGGASPGFDVINVQGLPNSISSPDFYTVELAEGEVVENIDFGNALTDSGSGNVPPRIVSQPVDTAFTGVPYQYNVRATDVDEDELTYTLLNAPEGMSISDTGEITWDTGAIGTYEVEIQVDDGNGGIVTQAYELNVTAVPVDDEAPNVNLGFNGTVFEPGETLNLQIQGFDNVGVTDLDLTFNGESLTLDPDIVDNGVINTAAVTLDEVGVFEVLATATDLAGNVDTETLSIRVLDPTDTSAPVAELDLSGFDPLNLVIDEKTDIIGTVNDPNLEFYRVEIAPVSLIDLNNPAANDPDYITVAEGTGNVDNDVLATIDPNLYRNDNYYIRIYTQDFSGNINVEGIVAGISSQNKPGEFSLEFTDLSIPVAGVPLEITRRYSSLDANFQGDFGFGWELGLQDAEIVEAAPDGRDLSFDNFFGGNSLTVGTRVTLTTPDGRRVGFTFDPVIDGGSIFGARYAPRFVPDLGVYETLEVPYTPLSVRADGSVNLYVFNFTYNPSDYILTTKDGTKYNYNQNQGLQTVEDRNGNTLTFSDDGIESSTGVEIDFIRDSEGRITEIIDPEGESITYDYDANEDLVGVTDREDNETTLLYEGERPHYLTELIDPLGRTGVRTEYDENGQISAIFDANGNALDINYDSTTSRQTVTDPFGNITTLILDERGNLISEINPLGGITNREYDEANNVTKVINAEGEELNFTYDNRGNITSRIDDNGNTTTYTYNNFGQITNVVDPSGEEYIYEYNDVGLLITETRPNGEVNTFEYDAVGNLTSRTDGVGNTISFEYDSFGNQIARIDANGNRTEYTYNSNGQQVSSTTFRTDGNGNQILVQTNNTYDAEGRLTSITDSSGNTRTYQWSPLDLLISETDTRGTNIDYTYNAIDEWIRKDYSDGTYEEREYDDAGNLIYERNRMGIITTKEYDALNRVTNQIDPFGREINTEYDLVGRQTFVKWDGLDVSLEYDSGLAFQLLPTTNVDLDLLPPQISNLTYEDGLTVDIQRDANGNQIDIDSSINSQLEVSFDETNIPFNFDVGDGQISEYDFDEAGRLASIDDPTGFDYLYEYDGVGNIISATDNLGNRTTYEYDEIGNLLSRTDANGNTTRWEYNNRRQMIMRMLPEGETEFFEYNSVGDLIKLTTFQGDMFEYEYDSQGRLTKEIHPDGSTEEYTYSTEGLLLTVDDSRGTTTYSYDAFNRVVSVANPDTSFINYSYDSLGRVSILETPSGTTTYAYDLRGRISSITDVEGDVTTYAYSDNPNITTVTFSNGVESEYTRDNQNRLIEISHRNSLGEVIAGYVVTYDDVNNITTVTEADGSQIVYSFDELNRLSDETLFDQNSVQISQTNYTYDAVGNRLSKTDETGITTYQYNANNQLISAGNIDYIYDDNGNIISKTDGSDVWLYEYDEEGRLLEINTPNGDEIVFDYDYDGTRVSQTVNGQTVNYLVDNQSPFSRVLSDYTTVDNILANYTYSDRLLFEQDPNGEDIFFLDDYQGSGRQQVNESGVVILDERFDAFGNPLNNAASDSRYQFLLEENDPETSLVYLRARYLDPEIGRFLSLDPVQGFPNDPRTQNGYNYANNNPLIFSDPSGQFTLGSYGTIVQFGARFARDLGFATTALIGAIGPTLGASYIASEERLSHAVIGSSTINFKAPIISGNFFGGFGFSTSAELLEPAFNPEGLPCKGSQLDRGSISLTSFGTYFSFESFPVSPISGTFSIGLAFQGCDPNNDFRGATAESSITYGPITNEYQLSLNGSTASITVGSTIPFSTFAITFALRNYVVV